ncbi:coiled-coil domain-containing protein 159 [Sagmatias obliquidens]|uniref:coiled-coil domain-containing protein 159 n=1 Tax=Sagmatias obliquidens TaxID=3371155 RepID=UPI000F43EAFF|nr:coiled-coil domain-containing protein 159 [Lagenorhynchus obliquidens]
MGPSPTQTHRSTVMTRTLQRGITATLRTSGRPALPKPKSTVMIPESQKLLRCELESLRCQLQAQTKAFEFLNHSVTVLKDRCLQQIKIQQLEEVLAPPAARQTRRDTSGTWRRDGRSYMRPWLKACRGCRRPCMTTRRCRGPVPPAVYSCWRRRSGTEAQEEEITENLVNIQKMQKTQVKRRKVLTKMKQHGYETSNWPETEELPPGGSDSWRDDLQKDLGDIWPAVHLLQNSFGGLAIYSGGRPRAASLRA